MNMKAVFVGRHHFELLPVLLVLGLALSYGRLPVRAAEPPNDEEKFEVVAEESRELNDDQLGSLIKDFGGHLRDTMDSEMERLISEVEREDRHKPIELIRLERANKEASEDIKARIELAGDNRGALPQASLGSMASSFLVAASERLASAGSYIGSKLSSLDSNVARRIPAKLKRFFKWPTFLNFKIRYHKTYRSLREELYRQMIFLRTHIVVGLQHIRFLLHRDKHITGQNQFSDITNKEYNELVSNREAETEADLVKEGGARWLDERTLAALKEFEREGKNIFGQRVGQRESGKRRGVEYENDRGRHEGQAGKRQRRTRRDVDEISDDELNYSEDDEDDFALGNDLELQPTEADQSSFDLVSEFANDIDMSDLDEIDNNLDEVLNKETSAFEPIDLRDTGCIPRAENQNGCGCCYSYAVNSVASYYNCMDQKGAKPERYNARFVSDCGRYLSPPHVEFPYLNGCSGGRVSSAIEFVKRVGVSPFFHYNFARVSAKVFDSDTCAYPRPENLENHGWRTNLTQVPAFIKANFTIVKPHQIGLHLRSVGPVFVNVRLWKNMKDYEAGIYDSFEDDTSSVLHSMVIVGHERDSKGRHYFTLLNSFGIAWGENGYLRIYNDSLVYFGAFFAGLSPSV